MQSTGWSRSESWITIMQVVVGLAICSLCGALLETFHNGLPLVNFLGEERLQYDSVWACFVFGLSLVLFGIGLRGLAKACAAATFILGASRIIASVFPRALFIHPILTNPWLTRDGTVYESMGLLTALITLILGVALAGLLPSSQRTVLRSVFLASLASTVVALSLLLAFGAWSGSGLATESLQMAGDERLTSAIFILTGTTVLISVLLGAEHERIAVGRFAPVIVGLAVFGSVLVIWRAALTQETRYLRRGSELVASEAASSLERNLGDQIAIIERLSERMSFHTFNEQIWQREGDSILKNSNQLSTLAWSGPDYTVVWVAPQSAPLVGYNILQDPARGRVAQFATSTHQTEISSFSDLMIGRHGVVVFVPVFQDDRFRGTVSAALGTNWMQSLLGTHFPDHYFELIEGDRVQLTVSADSPKAAGEWVLDIPLTIRNAQWTLRVTPTRSLLRARVR